MQKTFYIFRHGETDYNAQKRMQGWVDIPLNANGVAQAHTLAQNLSDVSFDCIYSSPLSRALDTAKIVVGDKDTKIITDGGLREWNLGLLGGKIVHITDAPIDTPIDMMADTVNVPYALISNDDYVVPNGESYNMFGKRVYDAITNIAKNTDAQIIGIATHGGVAKVLIKSLTDVHWSRVGMPNCGFFKLEYDGEKFTLIDMPDWLSQAV